MPDTAGPQIAAQLVEEVATLVPEFLADPIDLQMSQGNAAFCAIDDRGGFHGRIFGDDKTKGRFCFGIVNRKAIQVWSTGYPTGRFEELVYTGKLDDKPFGIIRPDFIGWKGGLPLLLPDGTPLSAAFSGFRGIKDLEIVEQAVAKIPGLRIKRD